LILIGKGRRRRRRIRERQILRGLQTSKAS
jgi:hypothetical protein